METNNSTTKRKGRPKEANSYRSLQSRINERNQENEQLRRELEEMKAKINTPQADPPPPPPQEPATTKNVFDLSEILTKKPTVERGAKPGSDFVEDEPDDIPEEDKPDDEPQDVHNPADDFNEPEHSPPSPPSTHQQSNTGSNTEPQPEEVTEEPEVMDFTLPPDETADTIIKGFDYIQNSMLPPGYKKVMFTKDERRDMPRYMAKFKKYMSNTREPIEITEDDLMMFDKISAFVEYSEMVPLTSEEKAMLKKPLVKILEKKTVRMTPENALLLAAATISIPRVMPFASKGVMNLIERIQKAWGGGGNDE